jgi:hypothetical protein
MARTKQTARKHSPSFYIAAQTAAQHVENLYRQQQQQQSVRVDKKELLQAHKDLSSTSATTDGFSLHKDVAETEQEP